MPCIRSSKFLLTSTSRPIHNHCIMSEVCYSVWLKDVGIFATSDLPHYAFIDQSQATLYIQTSRLRCEETIVERLYLRSDAAGMLLCCVGKSPLLGFRWLAGDTVGKFQVRSVLLMGLADSGRSSSHQMRRTMHLHSIWRATSLYKHQRRLSLQQQRRSRYARAPLSVVADQSLSRMLLHIRCPSLQYERRSQ